MDKNHLRVSSLFIASVIGAGFASGKEIVTFFSSHRKASIYGLGMAGVLFFLFTYRLYNLIYISKDKESFSELFPRGIRGFYGILSYCLLFCMYSVMIAGLSSASQMIFNVNGIYFGILFTIIFMIAFIGGKTTLINTSLIISPVMCFGIVFIGIYYLLLSEKSVFNPFEKTSFMWALSSLSYVSYNSLPLISLFWETKDLFVSEEVCLKGALYGSMSLTIMSIILDFILKAFYVKVKVVDLPILFISETLGKPAEIISEIILILAMVSTALSTGYSLISITERRIGIKSHRASAIVCVCGFFMSVAGFSNLVEYVYPIFGYAGFIVIMYVLFKKQKTVRQ